MGKYIDLIENNQENRSLLTTQDKCDSIDYLIAVGCGAVGGLIDVFLVGAPGDSTLQIWTDAQANKVVTSFAKIAGWKPKGNETTAVKDAIYFLEKKFKVNYDQSVSSAASNVFGITPNNHHMKSLGHSPDIFGLFFSIRDQFNSTSTFLSGGQLITMDTETFELRGNCLISKLFCGFANWLGHLASDFAGSHKSKGRGSGIVMPFYELFSACNFGSVNINGEMGTIADLATKAFESGYDARFGIAQAIPVIITDLAIRLTWSIRRRFQFKRPLNDCIPMRRYADLRIMILLGNGTLCVIDAIDVVKTGIQTEGNVLAAFMKMNLVGWCKLIESVLIEVCIQVGINADFEAQVEAFKRVNNRVNTYLKELEKLDIEQYKEEVLQYQEFADKLELIHDDDTLNKFLLETYDRMGIEKPWKGDFDSFMSDRNNHLVYKL